MNQFHRIRGYLLGAGLWALITALAVIWVLYLPVTSARAAQLQATKPVTGWYVCRDLGIGSVPGVPDPRQRLQLCHNDGWTVNVYCTQVGLPVPPLGRSCTRIGAEKYSCGADYQILREYRILETPVDTPVPNATPTQFSTPPPATATEIIPTRPPTGGEGNLPQVRRLIFTEISIFTLAICVGFWFLWRLEKYK